LRVRWRIRARRGAAANGTVIATNGAHGRVDRRTPDRSRSSDVETAGVCAFAHSNVTRLATSASIVFGQP
jgi:hypothetical protein